MSDLKEIRDFWEKRTIKFGGKAPVHIGRSRIYNWRMTRVHRRHLNEAIKLSKPKSVLEIGVGQGRLLTKVEDTSLFGIDISANMLKKYPPKNKLSSLNLVVAEAAHLPFKDNYFDLVYTCTVLLHIPSDIIETVISEIKRVATKNIFIIEPLPSLRHLDKPYSRGGYCFPHEYEELFQLPIKYRKRLDKFEHEAIFFVK